MTQPADPAILLLGRDPKEWKTGTQTNAQVHSSIIDRDQKEEATQELTSK